MLAGFIVRFRPNTPQAEIDRVIAQVGLAQAQVYHRFSEAIHGFAAVLPEPLISLLLRTEGGIIEAIEPDLEMRAFVMGPILDFLLRPAPAPAPPQQTVPEGLRRIGGLESSANIGRGGPSPALDVDLFVLDSGVQQDHPDLNVVSVRSFVPLERDTADQNGHGTLVAGVSAARDNGTHVVGVAPGIRVHGFKVLGRSGAGSMSNIIAAIDEVIRFKRGVSHNRVVMNLSLGADAGGPGYTSLDIAVREAVVRHGITAVVAAGNESVNAANVTPAHTLEAITVGSYGPTDQFSDFSNFGAVVDLLAPGENVLSTSRDGRTNRASGTSFSSPYVAGAAALYLARNPDASPEDVRRVLRDLAMDSANPRIRGCPAATTDLSLFVRQL